MSEDFIIKLKDCPCCGAEARLYVSDGVKVMCTMCHLQTASQGNAGDYKANPIKNVVSLWNKRSDGAYNF